MEIRAYAERVEFWQEGKIVGAHARALRAGQGGNLRPRVHYLPEVARGRKARRNSATAPPLKDWDLPALDGRAGGCSAQTQPLWREWGTARWVDILGAVADRRSGMPGRSCLRPKPCKTRAVVRRIAGYASNIPGPAPRTGAAPDHRHAGRVKTLSCEPVADCRRYDSLRKDPDMERSQVLDAMVIACCVHATLSILEWDREGACRDASKRGA